MSDREAAATSEARAVAVRIVDPRAVRVGLAPASAHAGVEAIVIEPSDAPLTPAPMVAGAGVLGGVAAGAAAVDYVSIGGDGIVIVDGAPAHARLDRLDGVHGVLIEAGGSGEADVTRTPVLLMPVGRQTGRSSGVTRREVVVDGWRVEVEIEPERRASLRERARRGREETARGGPTQVRAIIPGRIVSVTIVPGDPVEAWQQLLVVEAMKMQN